MLSTQAVEEGVGGIADLLIYEWLYEMSALGQKQPCAAHKGMSQRGESPKAIGRAFGKPSSSIYNQVATHGGDFVQLLGVRSRLALTLAEREEISRGIAAHQSARSLARAIRFRPACCSCSCNSPTSTSVTGCDAKFCLSFSSRDCANIGEHNISS